MVPAQSERVEAKTERQEMIKSPKTDALVATFPAEVGLVGLALQYSALLDHARSAEDAMISLKDEVLGHLATVNKLRNGLTWVLPMAKGYAREHQVGDNIGKVIEAEHILRSVEEVDQASTPKPDFYNLVKTLDWPQPDMHGVFVQDDMETFAQQMWDTFECLTNRRFPYDGNLPQDAADIWNADR